MPDTNVFWFFFSFVLTNLQPAQVPLEPVEALVCMLCNLLAFTLSLYLAAILFITICIPISLLWQI